MGICRPVFNLYVHVVHMPLFNMYTHVHYLNVLQLKFKKIQMKYSCTCQLLIIYDDIMYKLFVYLDHENFNVLIKSYFLMRISEAVFFFLREVGY